jgi:hypothetical protein
LHSGISKTTGSDIGPFPSTLVASTVTVIDTPPLLENRQGEDEFIFMFNRLSVCVQISPMQADAGIVIESTLLSEIMESEIEYVIV